MSAALVVFLAGVFAAACSGTPARDLDMALVPGSSGQPATVRVTGLSSSELASFRAAPPDTSWDAILNVHVAGNDSMPVAGAHSVTSDALVFTPRFPFDPGRTYVVRLDPARFFAPRVAPALTKEVQIPARPDGPRTSVTAIAPTSHEWPENLLRFYIQFSAPMSRASALGYVRLVDDADAEVKEAFLPLDVDMWNADRTRFTVFFDPGRVKTGIRPNVELGRAMHAGRRYAIVVDAAWPDGQGRPLTATFRHEFTATAAEERAVTPSGWMLSVPAAGARNPLIVTFPWPLDRGLLQRAIGVTDANETPVDGVIAVDEGERVWRFTPSNAWKAGSHGLVVLPILEDAAGNRVGRAFEIAMFQKPVSDKPVTISFLVK